MNRFFYSSVNEAKDVKHQPENIENRAPKLKSEVLFTGNKVVQSPQLTERIHEWRNSFIRHYDSIFAELSSLRSAANNEIYSVEKYVQQNVLTDSKENNQMIVPGTILSLGAFFCGRVLTNKDNWGHRSVVNKNISVLGRIFTSLPLRCVFPLILAGIVFDQITPGIEGNVWNTFQRDFVPDPFIEKSHNVWNQVYTYGIKRSAGELNETIQKSLQNNIRCIRKSIINLDSNEKH